MKRPSFNKALAIIGLPRCRILNRQTYEAIIDRWRAQAATAHRNHDHDLAAILSQCKEALKAEWDIVRQYICPFCDRTKALHEPVCARCRQVLNELESDAPALIQSHVPIPQKRIPHRETPLRHQMRGLARIGDSFHTDATRKAIDKCSRDLQIKTLYRTEANGHRVWRTDGKRAEEVNAIIQQRHRLLPS